MEKEADWTLRNILFYVPQMQGPTGDGRLNMDWTDAITQKVMGQRWKTVTLAAYVLAAIAREEGYEITVWDEDFRGPIANQELERVEIVCMYVVTPTASRAYEVSQRVKPPRHGHARGMSENVPYSHDGRRGVQLPAVSAGLWTGKG